ncbi:hypothetical protein EGN72_06960 [Pseudorhodobacter sp. E13]|nr:hypothetical protein EGN72_06960 [Pseudorhodobacter sp. E13]
MIWARPLWIFGITVALAIGFAIATMAQNGDVEMSEEQVAEELVGKDYAAAVSKLGTPIKEDRFELSMTVHEFRVELLNIFDAATIKAHPPQIREVTWSLSKDQNLTLWFKQDKDDWQAVHHFFWHPDAEF